MGQQSSKMHAWGKIKLFFYPSHKLTPHCQQRWKWSFNKIPTYRIEQSRKTRNKPWHVWSGIICKRCQDYTLVKESSKQMVFEKLNNSSTDLLSSPAATHMALGEVRHKVSIEVRDPILVIPVSHRT